MAYSTYSFGDTIFTLSFPGFPTYTMNGNGVGEINISYSNDNTAHDIGASGEVMVSKIKARNGTVTVSVQQTSSLNTWLTNTYNSLYNAVTTSWAAGVFNISSANGLFDDITLTGVSFQKPADRPFQAQGQMVQWTFMAADISSLGSSTTQVATTVAGRLVQ